MCHKIIVMELEFSENSALKTESLNDNNFGVTGDIHQRLSLWQPPAPPMD